MVLLSAWEVSSTRHQVTIADHQVNCLKTLPFV